MAILTFALRRRLKPVTMFVFFLKIIRFFGGFPYTWTISEPRSNDRGVRDTWVDTEELGYGHISNTGLKSLAMSLPHSLNRKCSLVFWSWVLAVLLPLSGIYVCSFKTVVNFFNGGGSQILTSTQLITEVGVSYFVLCMTLLLLFHLVRRSAELATLIERLKTVIARAPPTCLWEPNKGLFFFMLMLWELYIIVGITDVLLTGFNIAEFQDNIVFLLFTIYNIVSVITRYLLESCVATTVFMFYCLAAVSASGYSTIMPSRQLTVTSKQDRFPGSPDVSNKSKLGGTVADASNGPFAEDNLPRHKGETLNLVIIGLRVFSYVMYLLSGNIL